MYSIDTMTSLNLGEQGEHLANEIRVDMSPWVDEDNTLRFYIVALRHAEANPYIPATTMEDNILVWPVTSADTGITGAGLAQFVATDGTRIVKSKRIKTTVGEVIPGTDSDTPPDPASAWVESVINTVQAFTEAAQSAKADAESAAEHAQDVTEGIDQAGAAQIEAVQAKGDEVINSIPADYSTLTDEVTGLKSAIDQTNENLDTLFDGGTRTKDLTSANWIEGQRVSGYTTVDGKRVPSISAYENTKYCVIDITNLDIVESTGDVLSTAASYSAVEIVDSDGVLASTAWNITASSLANKTASSPFLTYIDGGGYRIDVNVLKSTYPNNSFGAIYFCSWNNDGYEWLSKSSVYSNSLLKAGIDENAEAIETLEGKLSFAVHPAEDYKTGYVRYESGGIVNNANYRYLEFGVIPGITINYKSSVSGYIGLAFYDAFDKFLSGSPASRDGVDLVVPDDAYICRASTWDGVMPITFNVDAITIDKVAETARIVSVYNTNPVIVVPSDSIAVVGHEWILYFNGVIAGLHDAHYVVVSIAGVNSKMPITYDDSVRLTPTAAMIGDHVVTLTVYAKSSMHIVAQKSFTLRIIADTAITGKTAIFIGDSLTDDGYYPCEIQGHLSNGGITSLGTKSDTRTIDGDSITAANEGRGGWNTTNYINDASVSDVENAFYNPSTQKFNFSYYMSNNGFSGVDIVSIYLGTNGDVGGIAKTIENIDFMISSIHDYNANIKIIICLFHQIANQSGVGNHNGLQSSVNIQQGRIHANQKFIDHFENNPELPNVYIAELNFGVDGNNDYSKVTQPLSSRNPETVVRLNNNVHPNVYGYLKIADNLYNRMLYLLTQ